MKARVVCEPCNTGWMSRLQEAAKPILIPLMTGAPITLRLKHLKLLSRWIAMTVMTVEFLPPAGNTVITQDERNFVHAGEGAPSNWRIWIGRHKRGAWKGHLVRQSIPLTFGEEIPQITKDGHYWPNTQCSTFIAGELYVTVISSALRSVPFKWRFNERANSLLREIWPVRDRVISWPPPDALTDQDALRIASAFAKKVTSVGKPLFL
jgi:hypothetical protein